MLFTRRAWCEQGILKHPGVHDNTLVWTWILSWSAWVVWGDWAEGLKPPPGLSEHQVGPWVGIVPGLNIMGPGFIKKLSVQHRSVQKPNNSLQFVQGDKWIETLTFFAFCTWENIFKPGNSLYFDQMQKRLSGLKLSRRKTRGGGEFWVSFSIFSPVMQPKSKLCHLTQVISFLWVLLLIINLGLYKTCLHTQLVNSSSYNTFRSELTWPLIS